jgi:hypothetical protein
MTKVALTTCNHKNGHGRRESDLAVGLTRWLVDLDALEADAKQEIINGKQKLSRLSARLADLERKLASFDSGTKAEEGMTR